MNTVTILWSAIAAMCLTLAGVHLAVWLKQRDAWANLLFSVCAVALAAVSGLELGRMFASTTDQIVTAGRWQHVTQWIVCLSVVGFVRLYLRAGRPWLAWTVIGLRSLVLVVNFILKPNINFSEISGLKLIPWLGEQVVVPVGKASPWLPLSQLSWLLLLGFFLEATLTVWRRGDRRRAAVVGGSLIATILLTVGPMAAVMGGWLVMPLAVSPAFLPVILGMAYELSRDLLRARDLNLELQAGAAALMETERRMALAVEMAQLGVWTRDLLGGGFWASDRWRTIFGFKANQPLDFAQLLARIHDDDRAAVEAAFSGAAKTGGSYELEYRIVGSGGETRWIASHGIVDLDVGGHAVRARGVSLDITGRRQAESDTVRVRNELAHLSRVTTLGELSGSLAHELNQPLATILSNAQAAQRLLAQNPPDLAEVRAILADIVSEDIRAGQVIQRLRALLKQGEARPQTLDLNALVAEVLRVMRSDLIGRGVTVRCAFEPALPTVVGDPVQFQQVVLNLILNACDAMESNEPRDRRLLIATAVAPGGVAVSIHDNGCGLPSPDAEQIFRPFYTTKSKGLGLGLGICRSILAAFQGRLWAEANPDRGATLHFELPAAPKA